MQQKYQPLFLLNIYLVLFQLAIEKSTETNLTDDFLQSFADTLEPLCVDISEGACIWQCEPSVQTLHSYWKKWIFSDVGYNTWKLNSSTNFQSNTLLNKFVDLIRRQYYWVLQKTDVVENSNVFEIQLSNLVDSNNKEMMKIMKAWYKDLAISTMDGMHVASDITYNESCDCWLATMKSTNKTALASAQKRSSLLFKGWLLSNVLLKMPISDVAESEHATLIASDKIIGRIYLSSCNPLISVLAAKSTLIFTDNGFESTYYISEIEGVQNSEVTSIALTSEHVSIVLGNQVFISFLEKINFKKVHMTENITSPNILGISSPKVCYRGALSLTSVENSKILAWSTSHLFEIVLQENLQVRKIHLQNVLDNYPEHTLFEVLFSPNPSHILLVLQSFQIHVILECSLETTEIGQCAIIAIPETIREERDIQMEVLNTAHTSLLLKTQHAVTQLTKRGNFVFTSNDKIDHVYVNPERNAWLIKTEYNSTYYGHLYNHQTLELHTPHSNDQDFAYHFRKKYESRFLMIKQKSHENNRLVDTKVYPLLEEIKHALWRSSEDSPANSVLVLPTSHSSTNVLCVNSILESISLCFSGIFTREYAYSFSFTQSQFENLNLVLSSAELVESEQVASGDVLISKTAQIEILVNCTESPQNCNTGYALLEIDFMPENNESLSSLAFLHSEVYVINVSCSSGLNIRVEHESIMSCTTKTGCHIKIKDGSLLSLIFNLYKYDSYLSRVSDNIVLNEVNNVTGFQFNNINLLKKDCYQCSHLIESNSSSELVLQVMKSACPCRANIDNEDKWVGNITFEHVTFPANSNNTLHFSAELKSKSFCDLVVEFKVEILQEPSLLFFLWEYIIMMLFVLATVICLCVSYQKYLIHMKINRFTRNIED